eukprot:3109005-Pyramimonas_sp.AAC.1
MGLRRPPREDAHASERADPSWDEGATGEDRPQGRGTKGANRDGSKLPLGGKVARDNRDGKPKWPHSHPNTSDP